ncbi:LysR substrate-binding domain-containing protein [Pelomonas sp. P7]|uniref:LysR substrate-binding domain-containing protein n=1 Tax=Pelomonas caseinilytica TaxID=2906763 RepID=A0ABS8XI03_9BURK|nr:LysR substrate-binding domain-containing protein [Pelomonas sp. P7]MCE4538653.1 LysR substrate-binding domain-containing protein [Pelomonas sp. P7]
MSSFRRLPPIHALAAFEAAARLGTFARAAEELCITHSAVSHRIRQLEEQLGTTLFERGHMQVTPTAEGELFLKDVRQAMRQLEQATGAVGHEANRRLRVTASPAFAAHVLAPNLADFLAAHPGLQIEIDASTRSIDLGEGGFDVALRFGRPPWPQCEARLLLAERVMALASPGYAARFGPRRSLADLSRAALVDSRPFGWEAWRRAVDGPPLGAGAARPHFGDNWAAVDAAGHGLGVVLANRLTSSAARRDGRLVRFVDAEADLAQHYYGVYPSNTPRREAIVTFLDWVAVTAARVQAAGEAQYGLPSLCVKRQPPSSPSRARRSS